jgi:hypothetical protein
MEAVLQAQPQNALIVKVRRRMSCKMIVVDRALKEFRWREKRPRLCESTACRGMMVALCGPENGIACLLAN